MSSAIVEIHDAKLQLDDLLLRAGAGEEIILSRQGKPVAKLIAADNMQADRERGFGMFKGQIAMSEDFDAPLSEEELREWEK